MNESFKSFKITFNHTVICGTNITMELIRQAGREHRREVKNMAKNALQGSKIHIAIIRDGSNGVEAMKALKGRTPDVLVGYGVHPSHC